MPMGNTPNQSYDFLILLKSGFFDIKKLAEDNSSLRVGEYFNSLSDFMYHFPSIISSLDKLALSKGDVKDLLVLSHAKKLLTDIGCFFLIPNITYILANYENNPQKIASLVAKLYDDVSNLSNIIIQASKKINYAINIPQVIGISKKSNSALYKSLSIPKILEQLKNEEANRKLCILAIDNSITMLNMITSCLDDIYKVYTVKDPRKLTDKLKKITPDLFLIHYDMPYITGIKLIPVIRSFDEHKDTPIIFLTSPRSSFNIAAAMKLGVCDHVVTPLNNEVLLASIKKYIVKKTFFE